MASKIAKHLPCPLQAAQGLQAFLEKARLALSASTLPNVQHLPHTHRLSSMQLQHSTDSQQQSYDSIPLAAVRCRWPANRGMQTQLHEAQSPLGADTANESSGLFLRCRSFILIIMPEKWAQRQYMLLTCCVICCASC